jgi:NADPH2:quinone reductase
MRAIQITEFGGPEVLVPTELPEPEAREGTTRIRVTAAGVNFADTHQAENSYLAPAELPLVPGAEAAGTDPDGRRVVALLANGGYAEVAVASSSLTFPVAEGVDDAQALSLVLQGLTAYHLLRTSAQLREGESVLVHAAAGGVGTLAVQLAKRFGAGRVIGSASTDDKRELALDLGADAVIDSRADDVKSAVETANEGRKVDVVLDMTGGATTDGSLAALAPFGRLCFYGMASRRAPSPVELGNLMHRSRGVLGFWLVHCMADPARYLREPMEELMGMVAAGELRTVVGETYPLSEARRAHEDLRARRTTGKLVLDPSR